MLHQTMPSARTGLTRHFTTRRHKTSESSSNVQRTGSLSIRSKISGPVELISTTNLLSYNAPDIHPRSASSKTASSKSDEDSDSTAPTVSSNSSSPPTSPEFTATQEKPSPEPNHLSSYFTTSASPMPVTKTPPPAGAPSIPRRAASHTKKSSDIVSRKPSTTRFSNQSNHSVSSKSSMSSFSRISSSSTATSHASIMSSHSVKYSSNPVHNFPAPHAPGPAPVIEHRKAHVENPFGSELEKVTEIAEEFGIKDRLQAADEEEKLMREKGLYKFRAEDYLSEIQDLVVGLFADIRPLEVAPGMNFF